MDNRWKRRETPMRTNGKRLLIAAALVAASTNLAAGRADAQGIHVDIGIPLPSISFHAAPQLVALPGTYAYVVPEYEAEIFFYDGFWWRPYQGRWYRSSYYDRGWEIYGSVPVFYSSIPRDWRTRYRNRDWDGRRWDYERVSYDDVKRNWSTWKRDRHWDRTIRAAGEPDYRTERSRSAPDQRIEDRTRSGDSNRRIEQKSTAPDRRIEKRSTTRPDSRVEQRSAPAQRSDRGPARTERAPSSNKGASKARSSGGGRGSQGKGGQGQGRDGGQGKGQGKN
jgi:hypothetical protein